MAINLFNYLGSFYIDTDPIQSYFYKFSNYCFFHKKNFQSLSIIKSTNVNIQSYLIKISNPTIQIMLQRPIASKRDHKKRYSQSKGTNNQIYKLLIQENKKVNTHNRSPSTTKNNKTRLMTDYEDYEPMNIYSLSQKNKNTNAADRNFGCTKKSLLIGNVAGKKSNTHDTQVYSTKHNQQRNLQIKNLFNQNKKKPVLKPSTFYHPLLKFITNKNKQHNKNSVNVSKQSPYLKNTTINKYEHIYLRNTSQHNRRQSSSKKKQGSISLRKNQINLPSKIQKINVKINTGPRISTDSIKLEKKPNYSKSKTTNLQEEENQATVKIIKKAKEQINSTKNKKLEIREDYSSAKEQSYRESDGYGLTDEEQEIFGDRFPYGFDKVKLLGRGGFSLVWLGKHIKSGKLFAIKQIITKNTHQTHIKEIWFGTMFFTLGGIPKPQFASSAGIKNLARMYSYEINQLDTWIFYEKCGNSLGSTLYDIRSEKIFGEQRLYKIFYKPIYMQMSRNPNLLKKIVIEISKTLALLSESQIVHSDLKTENILIRFDTNDENQEQFHKIIEVKLIDYGSSFQFQNISQFSMATPEYMPPQILNYIIHENQGQYEEDLYEEVMTNYKNPWVVDMWSLGCVLLQIIVGVPLWMSLPLLVPNNNNQKTFTPNSKITSYMQKQGLFAVKGRLFPQIIQKQRKVVGILDSIIRKQNYSRIQLSQGMKAVLKGMLQIDFTKRISPKQVILLLEAQSSTV